MWRAALRAALRALAPALVASAPVLCAAAAAHEAPLATTFPLGLTSPGATEDFYTTALDLGAPLLLRGSGDFMAAARADARARLRLGGGGAALRQGEAAALEGEVVEHLRQASSACSKFLDSGLVHDREEVKAALGAVLLGKGRLALLLGGKSVGKSLLLQEMARQPAPLVGADGARRALLYVDARSCGGDLAAGLVAALQREALELQRLEGRRGVMSRQAQAEQPAAAPGRALALLPSAERASIALSFKGASLTTQLDFSARGPAVVEQSIALLAKVAETAQAQGYLLCLIVDEANLIFPAPPGPPGSALPAAPPTPAQLSVQLQLAKLVELTKQSRQMNVLLVSSEYTYPYRLRNGHFFNTTNFTDVLFAGEVPPAAMRQLLVQRWGLGPRLADVFVAFYGGHVHMAALALEKLGQQLDEFNCEEVAPSGVLSAIVDCIEGEGGGGPMAAMLRALAVRGLAPVSSEANAQAQALSLANVGGLVTTSSRVAGLPQGLRSGVNFGVVPSSQFVVREREVGCPTPPPSSALSAPPPAHARISPRPPPFYCTL